MNKLNKSFKINPLYEADSYKIGHKDMLAPGTTKEYWTWIPRSLKYIPKGIDKIMSSHQQMVWRYIHSNFQEFFFDQPVDVAVKFGEDMCKHIGKPYNYQHFVDLHKLRYLPVRIKALPEGIFTKPNIPHMTGINTVDGYAWLGLYLETLVSKLAWQGPIVATIAHKFKSNAVDWVKKTDPENLWLADYMCHDFHSRGGNPFTSIAVGLGHAMSNLGSDTLNVIPASRYYYDFDENDVPIFSVTASEHSVTCTGLFRYEDLLKKGLLNDKIKEFYSFDLPCEGSVDNPDYLTIAEWLNLRDWLIIFPDGVLSGVADTMNLWKYINHVVARLKKEILARNGKFVVRPDSGEPVDIICGTQNGYGYNETGFKSYNLMKLEHERLYKNCKHSENEYKGVIELLWDTFGGTINSQGYKVLDPHIGAIYGDSINLERQVQIYERLAAKGFAATNIVLGIGSYTYVMITRDTGGYAAKGAWFEVVDGTCGYGNSEDTCNDYHDSGCQGHCTEKIAYNIYKDPVTDDGTKKSLKGMCAVLKSDGEDEYYVKEECTFEEEAVGELQTIYEDGKFYNQTTLLEIRNKLK